MKILHRQIAREFLIAIGLFFLVFTSLFILVELNELRGSVALNLAAARVVLHYFLLRVPYLAYFCLPMAALMAGVLVTAVRANRAETVAAFAAGISPWRLLLPLTIIGLFFSFLLLLGAEWLIPDWSDRADYLRRVVIERRAPPERDYLDLAFVNGGGYVMADKFSPVTGMLTNLTLIEPDSAYIQARVTVLPQLRYFRDNTWVGDDTVSLPEPRLIEFIAVSSGFKALFEKPVEALRLSSLLEECETLSSLARVPGAEERLEAELTLRHVRLQIKLAFPLLVPLLALLGASVGMSLGRQRGLMFALSGALVYTLGYLLLLQTTVKLAEAAAGTPALQLIAPLVPWSLPLVAALFVHHRLRRW